MDTNDATKERCLTYLNNFRGVMTFLELWSLVADAEHIHRHHSLAPYRTLHQATVYQHGLKLRRNAPERRSRAQKYGQKRSKAPKSISHGRNARSTDSLNVYNRLYNVPT